MSKLQDFLNDNLDYKAEEEIVVSDRFRDSEGNLLKFKVKSITEDQYDEAIKKSKRFLKKGKVDLDSFKLMRSICIEGTVDPCFKDSESLKKAGLLDPEKYISKVLLPGEIKTLSEKILELSGFEDNEELIEEAKN